MLGNHNFCNKNRTGQKTISGTWSSSLLGAPFVQTFGFRWTLRQFCGVYSALAADMKGYAMPLGFWWGDGSKDSRVWCFARLAFKICSVRLRLARGEVILHTLKARSSSQNQRWFLTIKTSNRDGFCGLKRGKQCRPSTIVTWFRPSKWSAGTSSWHPWPWTNGWILKKETLA